MNDMKKHRIGYDRTQTGVCSPQQGQDSSTLSAELECGIIASLRKPHRAGGVERALRVEGAEGRKAGALSWRCCLQATETVPHCRLTATRVQAESSGASFGPQRSSAALRQNQ